MPDFWTALQQRRRRQPGTPVVTYLDPTRSERMELSAITLENAAAKIANALRDEYELDAGATVALDLPHHWQRSAWCAGAWTAGCIVTMDGTDSAIDLRVVGADVAEASTVGTPTVAVSSHPFGLPIARGLPAGVTDATLAIRAQPDSYLFDPPAESSPALVVGDAVWTHQQVWQAAEELADQWGLEPEGRLLVTDEVTGTEGWLACLAVPMARAASVVLVRGSAATGDVLAQERVTAVAAPSR